MYGGRRHALDLDEVARGPAHRHPLQPEVPGSPDRHDARARARAVQRRAQGLRPVRDRWNDARSQPDRHQPGGRLHDGRPDGGHELRGSRALQGQRPQGHAQRRQLLGRQAHGRQPMGGRLVPLRGRRRQLLGRQPHLGGLREVDGERPSAGRGRPRPGRGPAGHEQRAGRPPDAPTERLGCRDLPLAHPVRRAVPGLPGLPAGHRGSARGPSPRRVGRRPPPEPLFPLLRLPIAGLANPTSTVKITSLSQL